MARHSLCFAFLVAILFGASFAFSEEPGKILFIGHKPDHPHGSHMYMHTLQVLSRCVAKNTKLPLVVSDGWPTDAEALKGVKSIVMYTSPAAEILVGGEHADEFDRLMKQGVGLVTIHWASTVRQENFERLGNRWIGYLGGTWISNVGLSTDTSPLVQLLPDHPVCSGWSKYDLHDEFYLNPTISDSAKPVLRVTTKGKDVIVGWAHERSDGGRAFATTLGHYYRNFQIESFRRMVVNSILWSAKEEVPASGADVSLSEDELKLPPM